MRCKGLFGPADLVSVPYGVYGGPLGEGPEVVRELVERAVELGREEGAGRVELRCVEDPQVQGLAPSALYATFVRELPPDVPEIMRRMPKRARAPRSRRRSRSTAS